MAVNHTTSDKAASDFAALAAGTSGAVSEPTSQVQPQVPPAYQPQPQAQTVYTQPQPDYYAQPQAQPQPQADNLNYVPPGVVPGSGLLADLNTGDVPFNLASGKINALLQAFNEIADSVPRLQRVKGNWEFLVFEGATHGIAASAILYVRRQSGYATVYPLIVQDSMDPFPDLSRPTFGYGMPQGNVLIPQLPEELLTSDTTFAERVEQFVLNNYAGTTAVREVVLVGGRVLPPELEATNKQQIYSILFNANEAAESQLHSLAGNPKRFSLVAKKADEYLSLKADFNAGSVATSVGLPVRSDVSFKLYVQNDKAKQPNKLGMLGNAPFSNVHGYMTLQYTGQQQMMPMVPGMMPYGQFIAPMFQPIFNISRVDNQFGTASLGTQLLALSTVSMLTFNNMWMSCFTPNYAIQEPGADPKDIGLITLDVNYRDEPVGIPTNLKENGANLQAFLCKYLHQSMLYTMDVPELGDTTYIQRLWLEAADAVSNAERARIANATIINEANYLTNGAFGRHYKSAEPVVYNQIGRVEDGYFINEKGEIRSLAEIDYLYLLSKVGVEVARSYMDSFNPNYGDEVTRFAKRKAIYDTYFAGYQIRGYMRRLTLNPAFLTALGAALQDVGGAIRVEQQYHLGQSYDRAYHNQVAGIPMNGVAGFVQGGYYAQGNVPHAGAWRVYQPAQVALYNAPQPQPVYAQPVPGTASY